MKFRLTTTIDIPRDAGVKVGRRVHWLLSLLGYEPTAIEIRPETEAKEERRAS